MSSIILAVIGAIALTTMDDLPARAARPLPCSFCGADNGVLPRPNGFRDW